MALPATKVAETAAPVGTPASAAVSAYDLTILGTDEQKLLQSSS
jgi:hypothetical protein